MKQLIQDEPIDGIQKINSSSSNFIIQCGDFNVQPAITSSSKYYKICLYTDQPLIKGTAACIDNYGTTLFFGSSNSFDSWKSFNKKNAYCCIFTEEFFRTNNNTQHLHQSLLLRTGGRRTLQLAGEQLSSTFQIFQKMFDVYNLNYLYKDDLLRTYINIIVHEVLQALPSSNCTKPVNSTRVSALFFELLERQFPVESPDSPLSLRNAHDFASALSVHVNHLNRSVKESTGKSTTAHITDRIIKEAKFLLKYTKWPISHIAFGLGFEYPTYFNNYFKKQAGITPSVFRSG